MSLFQETGPYVPRTPPTPRKAPAIADPETAMKKLRALTRELREKLDHPPEVIQPLLKAAMSLLSAMHAFGHIDICGYGNRMKGFSTLCYLILHNHNGETSTALSNIGLLREEALRRIAIVAEEIDSEDEVDDMMLDNDENVA